MKKNINFLLIIILLNNIMFIGIIHASFIDENYENNSFFQTEKRNIDSTLDPLLINEKEMNNQCDIPTWYIGDTWMYNADIYSDSDNGTFDLSSTDLTITVINTTTITENETSYDVYGIGISGTVDGTFSSSIISGDVDGVIIGNTYLRRSDLAIVSYNISITGIITVIIFEYDFEMTNSGLYNPPLEYFDFQIKNDEQWNISSTASMQSSIYIEDFYDNSTKNTESITATMSCIDIENISVPAGIFKSFHLYTADNGTLEIWYAPLVGNAVKTFINRTNENETHLIYLNLSSYSLTSPLIQVTERITPPVSSFTDNVTVSGGGCYASSNLPVVNGNVSISIPYTGDQWYTTTNATGNFSYCIDVPIIIDNTNTTYDLGSEGIIVTISNDSTQGYKIKTITVIDNSTLITNLFDKWNFVSIPFNQTTDPETFILKYHDYYLNWTQSITNDNPTNHAIINQYFFGWNRTLQSYIITDLFNPGFGYWLFSYNSCELRANSNGAMDDFITELKEGWNIMSVPSEESLNKNEILINGLIWNDAVAADLINDYVFGWNEESQSYYFTDTLLPGDAYWLYAYEPCILHKNK